MSTLDRALFLGEAVVAMLFILAVLALGLFAVGYAYSLTASKRRTPTTPGGDSLMAVADAVREPRPSHRLDCWCMRELGDDELADEAWAVLNCRQVPR